MERKKLQLVIEVTALVKDKDKVSKEKEEADAFKKNVNDGTDTQFLNAVKDNDVFDWAPKTETQLYHGNADQQVFYLNSSTAVTAMKAKGGNVTLITKAGGTHGSTLQDYAIGTFNFFNGKK